MTDYNDSGTTYNDPDLTYRGQTPLGESLHRSASDSISTSDSPTRIVNRPRSPEETLSTSDSLRRIVSPPIFVRDSEGGSNGSGNTAAFTVESSRVNRVLVAFMAVRSSTDSPINWRPTSGSTTGQQLLENFGPVVISGTLHIRAKILINPTTGTGSGGAGQLSISNPSSAGYVYWVALYENVDQDALNAIRAVVTESGTAPADPSLSIETLDRDMAIWATGQTGSTNNATAGAPDPATLLAAFTQGTTSPNWLNVAQQEAEGGVTGSFPYTGSAGWAAIGIALTSAATTFRERSADDTAAIDADSISHEVFTPGSDFPRTAEDTAAIGADDPIHTTGWHRTAEDTTSVTDDPARLLSATRSLDDTTSVTDTPDRTVVATLAASDTTSVTDSIDHDLAVNVNRTAEDTTSVTDSIATLNGTARQPEDTTSVTDDVARLLSMSRGLDDTTSVTDDLSGVTAAPRPISDTTSVTDALAHSQGLTRAVEDTTSTNDTVDHTLGASTNFNRTAEDTLTTTDDFVSTFVLLPGYFGSGSAISTQTTGTFGLSLPPGVTDGDILIAQIMRDANTGTAPSISGWTLKYGPDFSTGSTLVQWVYWRRHVAGDPTTVTVTADGTTSLKMGRIHGFRNVRQIGDPFGDTDHIFGNTNTLTAPTLDNTYAYALAVALIAISNDLAIDPFTGETGGDWTEPVAETTTTTGNDGTIGIQIAPFWATGTISGGTDALAGTDQWLIRGFVLRPLAEAGEIEDTLTTTETILRRVGRTRTPTENIPFGFDTLGDIDRFASDTTSVTDSLFAKVVQGISGLPVGPEPPPWDPADGPPPPEGYYEGSHPAYLGMRDVRAISGTAVKVGGGPGFTPQFFSGGTFSASPFGRVYGEVISESESEFTVLPDVRAITGNSGDLSSALRDDFDRDTGGGGSTEEHFDRDTIDQSDFGGLWLYSTGGMWAIVSTSGTGYNGLLLLKTPTGTGSQSAAMTQFLPGPLTYPIDLTARFRFSGSGTRTSTMQMEMFLSDLASIEGEDTQSALIATKLLTNGTTSHEVRHIAQSGVSDAGTSASNLHSINTVTTPFHHVRLRITPEQSMGKFWTDPNSEPADWQITDTSVSGSLTKPMTAITLTGQVQGIYQVEWDWIKFNEGFTGAVGTTGGAAEPLLLDQFTRSNNTAVGSAETGQAWTETNDDGGSAAISSNRLALTLGPSSASGWSASRVRAPLSTSSLSEVIIDCAFRWSDTNPSGGSIHTGTFGPFLEGAGGWYVDLAYNWARTTGYLQMYESDGSNDQSSDPYTGYATNGYAILGGEYRMKWRLTSTLIQGKMWRSIESEPSAWSVEFVPLSNPLPQATTFGLGAARVGFSDPTTQVFSVEWVRIYDGSNTLTLGGWGTGPLGTWHNYSTFTEFWQQQPVPTAADGLAWVDGSYGYLQYGPSSDDPMQGLFLTTPAISDPGGVGTISLPLDIEFRATWSPGAPNCYIQLYLGPAHHDDLNSWETYTIQWYGPSDPTELYGFEGDIGGQGWAQWPIAPDSMFGSNWFHGVVGSTLSEPQTHGVRVKIHVDGTGSFGKAWIDDGRPEPNAWQIRKYWNPNLALTSRIAEFYRVLYFEQQVNDEQFKIDWIQIGLSGGVAIRGMVEKPEGET